MIRTSGKTDKSQKEKEQIATGSDAIASFDTNKTNPKDAISDLLDALYEGDEDETITLEEWRVIRKAAGLQIDPETAELGYIYEWYGADDEDDISPSVERRHIFRARGSNVWVYLEDLPEATLRALAQKHPNF